MAEYFRLFYIDHIRGISYILTNYLVVAATVVLLNDVQLTVRGIARKVGECLLCIVACMLFTALYYACFGDVQMDRVTVAVFIIGYALLRSRYDWRICLVRGCIFFASFMVMLPISEPIGELFESINKDFFKWAQYLTFVAVALLTCATVWFLRHFSFDNESIVQPQFMMLIVVISLLTVLSQVANLALHPIRTFNVLVCCILWVINMLTYYLFYSISKITMENVSLLTLRHKAEMEAEKYQENKMSYDELRILRHEIKNHNFYMKVLLDEGKYDQLAEYLNRTTLEDSQQLMSFDCGNHTIDVVMNHEMGVARMRGVTVAPDILVPSTLPFREELLCSLLSNLLDNAIEAAAASGQEAPQVSVSILPRQDYLFIKVTNPVDPKIPAHRRLSLKTTKPHSELHGLGTRIIQRVVDEYHGSIKYSMDAGGMFVTDVMLALPREG